MKTGSIFFIRVIMTVVFIFPFVQTFKLIIKMLHIEHYNEKNRKEKKTSSHLFSRSKRGDVSKHREHKGPVSVYVISTKMNAGLM